MAFAQFVSLEQDRRSAPKGFIYTAICSSFLRLSCMDITITGSFGSYSYNISVIVSLIISQYLARIPFKIIISYSSTAHALFTCVSGLTWLLGWHCIYYMLTQAYLFVHALLISAEIPSYFSWDRTNAIIILVFWKEF